LLFQGGDLGWNWSFLYQGDETNHKNNRDSRNEFSVWRLFIKASDCSLLHRAARLFLLEVSTLTTEMWLPSLPGSPGTSRLVTINFAVMSKKTVKCRTFSHIHLGRYY
jgi:hypothetical protein